MRSEEEFGLGAVFLPPTESLHHHLSCKCRSHLPQRLSSGFDHHRQVNRVFVLLHNRVFVLLPRCNLRIFFGPNTNRGSDTAENMSLEEYQEWLRVLQQQNQPQQEPPPEQQQVQPQQQQQQQAAAAAAAAAQAPVAVPQDTSTTAQAQAPPLQVPQDIRVPYNAVDRAHAAHRQRLQGAIEDSSEGIRLPYNQLVPQELPYRNMDGGIRTTVPNHPSARGAVYARGLTQRQQFLVFVKILLKYVDRQNNPHLKRNAKAVVAECTRRNRHGDPHYTPLQDAVERRLRLTLGEVHWARAKLCFDTYIVRHGIQTVAVPPPPTTVTAAV